MWKYFVNILLIIFVFANCATPGSPDGGPRDKTPPQIDSTASTPNYQTHFKKQTIEITFDEWLKLKNPTTQVLISPPFTGGKLPKISLKKKTVRFEFPDEDLKPNTTYTINFGDAVQDLTEGNPVPNLRYVFSTGDKIDSLQIKGKIIDAISGEAAPGVWMLLYLNRADTVVRTEKPFYFAKTDKSGSFQISNLPPATFKAFALEDLNGDFKFSAVNERIGFPDSLIVLNDTTNIFLNLKLFQETPPLEFKKDESKHYGLAKLRFNRAPYEIEVDIQEDSLNYFIEKELDTLKIWYDWNAEKAWKVLLKDSLDFKDTVQLKVFPKADFIANRKTKFVKLETGVKINQLIPNNPIAIYFNHPLSKIDTSKIILLEDSTKIKIVPTVNIDTTNKKKLILDYHWKALTIYELKILPDGITDWFGLTCDTIQKDFTCLDAKDLGIIHFDLTGFEKDKSYTIQLFTKNKSLLNSYAISNQKNFTKTLNNFPPGNYNIKIIEDLNNNGRWDPGNYDKKLQPEKIFTKDLETLRANWELEVKFSPQFQ